MPTVVSVQMAEICVRNIIQVKTEKRTDSNRSRTVKTRDKTGESLEHSKQKSILNIRTEEFSTHKN